MVTQKIKRVLAKSPWWLRVVLGTVTAGLGIVLLFNPTLTIDLVVIVVGFAFLLTGVVTVTTGLPTGSEPPGSPAGAARARADFSAVGGAAARSVRSSVFGSYFSALAFVAIGLVILGWQGITVQWLAVLVGVALIVSGIAGIIVAIVSSADERFAAIVFGLAGVAGGLLLLSWPRLGLPVIGLVLSGWLIYFGLAVVIDSLVRRSMRHREPIVVAMGPRSAGRRWLRGTSAVVVLVVAVVLLIGTTGLRAGNVKIVPDAFYTPPVGGPSEPGQLIRSEPLAGSAERAIPVGTVAWRILYTTTNPDGSPAVSSGTVIAPAVMPAGPRPVIAVAHGTTGIIPGCAPSVSAAPFGDGAATALEGMVTAGWVGVISDYVGLGTVGPHQYLVGEAEARNVLDSIRAPDQLDPLNLANSVAVWGHSQGGHGALWTGIIAREYAPEINLIGIAALAPATDLYSLADGVKDSAAGKIVSAYIAASWSEVFPDLQLNELITPRYRGLVGELGDRCFSGNDILASASITTQMFDAIFVDSALEGTLGDVLRANTPTGQIDVPVLIAQGGSDSLVLPSMQERWVAQSCQAGQSLDYRVYPGLDHLPLVAADSPLTDQLVGWTVDRLEGVALTPTC